MKSYLLDTQIILWILTKNNRLNDTVSKLVEDIDNPVYFSQISLYEIAIKQKIGKLPEVTKNVMMIFRQLIADGYDFVPISNQHIEAYQQVPLYDNHRDPFDRLLLATALQEKMTLVSADEKFKQYSPQIGIFSV
jgi:PIN domain nuclease of toxin-antitoxin system